MMRNRRAGSHLLRPDPAPGSPRLHPAPPPATRGARLGWGLWALAAAAVAALTLTDATTVLRPLVTWPFLLLAPGWAFVGGRRGTDLLTRLTVALGLSVAIDILVAQVMLMTGTWSPATGVVAVLAVSAAGLALHARRALRQRRTRRLIGALRGQPPQLASSTPAAPTRQPVIREPTATIERGSR